MLIDVPINKFKGNSTSAIIIGASVFLYFFKKQQDLDAAFEKSREGIQNFINNQNNKN